VTIPLPQIIPSFKRSLHELAPLELDEEQQTVGFFGLLMFLWGVIDFLRGPLLCFQLALCKQWVLFGCSVVTLLVTTCTTVHLSYMILNTVATSSPVSKRWLVKHGRPVALAVLVASSRLDMLSIFRLRLCGCVITDLPMENRHFHFVRIPELARECSHSLDASMANRQCV